MQNCIKCDAGATLVNKDGICEQCAKVPCPHCGKDLAEVGVRAYYEAYDDVDLEGNVIMGGDNTWEELLDAECGDCRGNVRKVCEKLPNFPAFNLVNYKLNQS